MPIIVRGVHPIGAPEPCYLIEIELVDVSGFAWDKVTQEDLAKPRSNWQVAYDERQLDAEGRRWAFFFHYLDFEKPLLTSLGPIELPNPTPRPQHLGDVEYLEP